MILDYKDGNEVLLCDHCQTIIAVGDNIPMEAINGDEDNLLYFCSTNCAIEHKGKLFKKINIINTKN